MTQYTHILTELMKDKASWRELKPELSKYNVQASETGEKDTRAGKIFEVFTKHYFLASPTEKDNFKQVWLFEETPLEVRKQLNLGNQDYGVDLVLQDIEDRYLVVQCKYKNDESSRLNWSADKIANLFAFCPKADGYIVFSNAVDLDTVSKTRHDKFTFYGVATLNEIDGETFQSIYSLLTTQKFGERTLFDPLPHQELAIQECVQWFVEGGESRGQLILPCGAGKTLAALWIKERLGSKNTLVLVPSLALLRQIKDEWAKQRRTVYQYLCVCSENDIDKETADTLVTHTYEIDSRVTTDSAHILSFLSKPFEEKVIFSTYHSLAVIAEAIKDIPFAFDFTFCDEAHKTAGVGNSKFSLVHNNQLIRSQYRLYATATPRIVKESLKKKLGDDLQYAYDMNDPEVFGYEFHRMTFKDAIEKNILVDYKIVAIGVNSEELQAYIGERRFVDRSLSIDELANNYALEHVMEKYKATHGLTFHSRVKLAEEFAKRHQELFPTTQTFSVSGEQPTSYRNLVLDQFKNSEKAIVSNARCLTEGVDVPTIDLVYFCDPKNSKVDIVQAVGRALRKKEGKKIGLIVVPIYHSQKENVENAISEGSFRNLLQVIRSLCDQDERLQEEINSIAFGKGERSSSKIDLVLSSGFEVQEKISLEGFEDKLKRALFGQIIEKSSNNWDLWYLTLQDYLEKNKGHYPSKEEDPELYSWISNQRNRKKSGTLKNEEIRKLNALNFVWSGVEWKWEKMFLEFEEYAKTQVFPPCKGLDEEELVKWYNYQLINVREDKVLTKDQKMRFLAINQKFEGPASRKKWVESYDNLVKFRAENPTKWPQYDRKNTKTLESELHVFCQIIRKRYREETLENYWLEKMLSIQFNFEGRTDLWTEYCDSVKELLTQKNSIAVNEIGENAYSWIIRHKKKYDDGELTDYETKKIEELNLDRFFETWETKFERIKVWVTQNGKLPTRISHKEYHSWLGSQRSRYKNNRLTASQIEALQSIGYDLEARGKERNEQKWLDFFHQLQAFIEKHGHFPRPTSEKKELYIWVQSQRAAKAGNLRNRKPLSEERIALLDSINFPWIGEGSANQPWEDSFAEFQSHVQPNGRLVLPSVIDGERNSLYTWWVNQKRAFEKGELAAERVSAFERIGINLASNAQGSQRDGFTKWANRLHEISKFQKETGRLPRSGKSKEEGNLYQSLARTKKAYQKEELSERQLALLKELNISMD
jgi:superfamily II DNA or RNA helicase